MLRIKIKNNQKHQLPISAFAICILMLLKTNEWYDETKRKNIKAETDNVELFFDGVVF